MDRCGKRRTIEQSVLGRRATRLHQLCSILLHRLLFLKPLQSLFQDLCRADMRRHDDPIVHPLCFAPRRDDTGATKVCQVPRNLGLWATKNLYEVTDTNLLISHEVQEAEARTITQGLKKPLHIECLLCHELCIRLDEYDGNIYIHLSRYEEALCRSKS